MLRTLRDALTGKDIRTKLLWTLGILLVYRIGAHITVPGVNADAMRGLLDNSSMLSVLNLLSGGGIAQFSLFALGVSPYITAQIVVQLLQLEIVPQFVEWSKQGDVGRRKLNTVTRWLTILLGFIQALGITAGLNSMSQQSGVVLLTNNSIQNYLLIGGLMTIGTVFATWLGEQITNNGLGQGISMIIFAGIMATLIPGMISTLNEQVILPGFPIDGIIRFAVLILSMILTIGFVAYVYDGIRRVRLQYTRSSVNYGEESYLPLRVNVSGVIPVIFASALLTTPQTILTAFSSSWSTQGWYQTALSLFNLQTTQGLILYAILIVLFTYFYAFVQVNPEKMSETLQKQGAYIVGVRPGIQTRQFMTGLLLRLSGVGAVFLAVVAAIPLLTQLLGLTSNSSSMALGGTSLLIALGVAIDMMQQIDGLILRRQYTGFITTSRPDNPKEIA